MPQRSTVLWLRTPPWTARWQIVLSRLCLEAWTVDARIGLELHVRLLENPVFLVEKQSGNILKRISELRHQLLDCREVVTQRLCLLMFGDIIKFSRLKIFLPRLRYRLNLYRPTDSPDL